MSRISRRKLFQIAAALGAGSRVGAAAAQPAANQPRRPKPVVAERVAERFIPVPFEAQELGGLFADRMRVNVEGRLLRIEEQTFLAPFAQRGSTGNFDAAWVGEHAGKFLDAACNAVRYRDDAELRHIADRMAKTLVASQEPDGYLGTYPAARRWAGWDVWVHKYNLIGLLSYYELTADPAVLHACRGMGDLLVRTFGDAPGRRDIISAGEHLGMAATSILEPMCRLYRFTGDARHLEFCKYVVRAYDQPHGPRIVSTLLNGGSVYGTAKGKAYEMLSNFNGGNGNISYYTSWVGQKEFTNAVLCCVSSGPRGISLIPQLAWGLQENALVINLYTPGRARFEIDGIAVEVVSETSFPSDGHVTLTVKPQRAVQFAVRLRVPEWATTFAVRAGSRTLAGTPGQMLEVSQTWQHASALDIRMDMPARVGSGAPTYPDYVSIQRGPQLLALEQALNPAVPHLNRAALTDAPHPPVPKSVAIPTGWSGKQLYEVNGVVGLPGDSEQLRLEQRTLRLVPFADANSGSVWITRAGRGRQDQPAVTAFARTSLSVVSLGLEPTAGRPEPTDIAEFVTDENPNTYCTVNPQDPGLANYLGAPPGQRGDPVWFAVRLSGPATISRVVFRHGVITATGGWFDTTDVMPSIEVARAPIPTSSNDSVPDDSKVTWERVAFLDGYPRTTALTPPTLANGQLFEIRLPQPLTIHGIRVVGKPGGDHASCAELSAYVS